MKSNTTWIIITILAIIVIVGGFVWYNNTPGKYDTFAACLKTSGMTFYGAFWCPHCQAEKAQFGKSVDKLPYVECSTPDAQGQTPICIANGISEYPTWVTKAGATTTGVLTIDQLSQMSGCVVPQ